MAGRVEEAGKTAGTLVGVLSGAEVGTAAIPIPVVGTFVGALVGGMLGSSVGQLFGLIFAKGTSTIVDTSASALARAAQYGAKRAELAVPEPPRTEVYVPSGSSPPTTPPAATGPKSKS
jgi:phage tail tape-measure protein